MGSRKEIYIHNTAGSLSHKQGIADADKNCADRNTSARRHDKQPPSTDSYLPCLFDDLPNRALSREKSQELTKVGGDPGEAWKIKRVLRNDAGTEGQTRGKGGEERVRVMLAQGED